MDANTVTLVVGLGGIISTLISGGLGFYFTSKARSSTLREAVYLRQLDLIVRIIKKLGRTRVYVTILYGEDDQFKEQARADLGKCVKELSELSEEGAAILPTSLWSEVRGAVSQVGDLLSKWDDEGKLSKEDIVGLIGADTKVALISRTVLGVEELSEESLKLFSSRNALKRVAAIDKAALEKIARNRNA